MDWQLGSSLGGNVIALAAFILRWWNERAPSVTVRETDYSPYPRFEVEANAESGIRNRYYLALELTNTSRKLSIRSYDILFDFAPNATVEQDEVISKSSLRPVETLTREDQRRRYRVRNFDPGDLVTFRFRLSNVSSKECKVDGYAEGVKLRRIQLKGGMTLV